jgi:hypothetical protein
MVILGWLGKGVNQHDQKNTDARLGLKVFLRLAHSIR